MVELPQYLHEAGWTQKGRMVACVQPRRLAAMTVAARVAREMNTRLGQTVGYAVRFDACADETLTRIKYLTDGMLLQETMHDPLLTSYSVIVLDEVHERSVAMDLLIGLVKKIQGQRPDLRIVVASATLDVRRFIDYYKQPGPSPHFSLTDQSVALIKVAGRKFPVDTHFLASACTDYVEKSVDVVCQIHSQEPAGDILIFLTGRKEIERALILIQQRLISTTSKHQLLPLGLYAGIDLDYQRSVFAPSSRYNRKAIFATNIAETSVTIEGIVYVVDCGYAKQRRFDATLDTDQLAVQPISRASASQRVGRAGRIQPGKAYRLYTREWFLQQPATTEPELLHSDLAPIILKLKALGIDRIGRFPFIDPLPKVALAASLELLYTLGALDNDARLTPRIGVPMANLPLSPMLGRALVKACELQCVNELVIIAAMLQVAETVFVVPGNSQQAEEARRQHKRFAAQEGDHITLANVYLGFLQSGKDRNWCFKHALNYQALDQALHIARQLYALTRKMQQTLGEPGTANKSSAAAAAAATTNTLPSANHSHNRAVLVRQCLAAGLFPHAARMCPDGSLEALRGGQQLFIHPSSVLFRSAVSHVVYHEAIQTTKTYVRYITVVDQAWLVDLAPHYFDAPGHK
ncbi:hypothetical protein H4R34_001669 [Dimargaris verticillata]|uniref:RNA helicase n=1 Tax=Dimargaris verticillata TaxID=2761393 RepID=A0A9W8BAB2_9FUNG|nr:hypothetical protein H4R34_001669 [Dimargaris verticillata]